ncbi:MAG: hypothetical protein H6767_05285 [Candidatus Peribacteria bacterium]|nr:MAG: hypothetical protein H6767_05285 [Candidatus Peribacteria bacterium]
MRNISQSDILDDNVQGFLQSVLGNLVSSAQNELNVTRLSPNPGAGEVNSQEYDTAKARLEQAIKQVEQELARMK